MPRSHIDKCKNECTGIAQVQVEIFKQHEPWENVVNIFPMERTGVGYGIIMNEWEWDLNTPRKYIEHAKNASRM